MVKRFAITLTIIVAGLAVGVLLSREPWKQLKKQEQMTKGSVQDMRLQVKERANLTRQLSSLETASGREERARERGYLKPGEKRLELDD